MAGFSTYAATAILEWLSGESAIPNSGAALTLYVALFDGDPGDTGAGGTDVTTDVRPGGRVAVTWGAVDGKSIENSAAIDFGNSDTGPVDITHVAVYDAATTGNLIYTWALETPRTVQEDDAVSFLAGQFSFTLLP